MLARLQQATTLGLLFAAVAWLAYHWGSSPVLGSMGFAAIVLAYSLFLAIEFVALYFVNRRDAATVPAPRWGELLRAWWGETRVAPGVFCWRQPFRSQAVPDHLAPATQGRRGVVLVHGFVCNRGFWTPWLHALRAGDHAFVALSLEPVFGSIDDYPPQIEAAVQRVTLATGLAPVLVCHSMGGLAARAWLRSRPDGDNAHARVHRIVTIGTPHGGTWLGRFSPLMNGQQMRLAGAWVTDIAAAEAGRPATPFICWYSNCDNIVFPTATGMLHGAHNRFVPGTAHVALAFSPVVMGATLDALRTDRWD